ncbi:hypothetical protein FS749_002823 [Ceratobasidium sp. UAMH 11750]|nr:hypothetical protein FS749_002823 [Ceratobasidium sp. UAMH 11750]
MLTRTQRIDMCFSYNVSWRLSGHQDRLLTYLAFSPSGGHLAVASEDRNLLLVDTERGTALLKLGFENQTSVLCGLWYSDDNLIVGCCNGYMYDICFNPTDEERSVTMSPILDRMTDQRNPGRHYLPTAWTFLEVVKAPSSDIGGLVHAMFFYPTDTGTNNLFIGYAELGWNIWSDSGSVTRVSPETSHNVCRVGRASLAGDQKSIVVSTLDHSIAIYALSNDGPNLSSLKEFPFKEVEDLSLVVPVASTLDGLTLGGTTYGEVPFIEGSKGEMSLIRHEETDHLIRVLATHDKKIVVGSSSKSGSVLKCYTSSAIVHSAVDDDTPKPLVFATATEALLGWDELDSRWRVVSRPNRLRWQLKLSRRACAWILLSSIALVLILSADPPGGPSFEDATKESYDTDMVKPTLKRHEYWVLFGLRHFAKYMAFQFKMWLGWMIGATTAFLGSSVRLVPKAVDLFILGAGKWMCEQVRVYRERGVCPKLEY